MSSCGAKRAQAVSNIVDAAGTAATDYRLTIFNGGRSSELSSVGENYRASRSRFHSFSKRLSRSTLLLVAYRRSDTLSEYFSLTSLSTRLLSMIFAGSTPLSSWPCRSSTASADLDGVRPAPALGPF